MMIIWKESSPRNGIVDVKRAIQELEDLADKNEGLTPEAVIEAAKDEAKEIHHYFEWDKDKAHLSFLKYQARKLIGSVRIIYSKGERVKKNVVVYQPAYINTVQDGERKYRQNRVVRDNDALRMQYLDQARKRLAYWYEQYQEFIKPDNDLYHICALIRTLGINTNSD